MTRAGSKYGLPKQWLPFVGPKLGVANAVYSLAIDPDDLAVHQVFPATTSLGRLLNYQGDINPRAGGAGATLLSATNCAMGELLERYASFAHDGSDRILLSYHELAERGCRPVAFDQLQQFSDRQYRSGTFPYERFTRETRVGWLAGTNLLDGLLTYVPGQLATLGYRRRSDEIARCFYPTSSGCAVATSAEEALSKGLLETIERDAFMIRWYARMAPPRLALDAAKVFGDVTGLPKQKLEISFHDLTIDGDIPVVGVTCFERTGRQCFFIISAAAALDVSLAARKALVEAGQGRPFVKSLVGISSAPGKDSSFEDFDSNVRFYAEPLNADYVEWFAENKSVSARTFAIRSDKTYLDSLAYLLDYCASRAFTPIAFDLTTPEMIDAGLVACRVIVPELVPLGVPSAPSLGHPRLAHFINCSKHPVGAVEIPEWIPHPFP